MGCDCHVSFAEDVGKLNLGLFDAIILGDIIEHVLDPCMLLFSLRDILADKGIYYMHDAQRNELSQSRLSDSGKIDHTASACRLVLQDYIGELISTRRISKRGVLLFEFS